MMSFQGEEKDMTAQRHKADLMQQMGAHEDARRAEKAARDAEERSIKVRPVQRQGLCDVISVGSRA